MSYYTSEDKQETLQKKHRQYQNNFRSFSFKSFFPDSYAMIKSLVTFSISNCRVEDSFSTFKLIKIELRTSIHRNRLKNLIEISGETDAVLNVD